MLVLLAALLVSFGFALPSLVILWFFFALGKPGAIDADWINVSSITRLHFVLPFGCEDVEPSLRKLDLGG